MTKEKYREIKIKYPELKIDWTRMLPIIVGLVTGGILAVVFFI